MLEALIGAFITVAQWASEVLRDFFKNLRRLGALRKRKL